MLGIHINTLRDWINSKSTRHDPTFPKPVRLGKGSIGFRVGDIERWVDTRPSAKHLEA
jgi:prophage regulatory protein